MRVRDRIFSLAPLVLGVNLWVATTVVPALGGIGSDGGILGALLILPLVLLGLGLWRRSEVLLLVVFPVSLLLPIGTSNGALLLTDYTPFSFFMHACVWIAYLFSASRYTTAEITLIPTHKPNRRPLKQASPRLPCILLAATAALYPLVLLYSVLFTESHHLFRRELFPGRATDVTTLLVLTVFAMHIVFSFAFWVPLAEGIRSEDRQLSHSLRRVRLHKNFRLELFLGATLALVLSAVWLYLRGASG